MSLLTFRGLKAHIKTIHGEPGTFVCDQCGDSFTKVSKQHRIKQMDLNPLSTEKCYKI